MLTYYADENFKVFEIKRGHGVVQAEKAHFHQELSVGLIETGSTTVEFEDKTYFFRERDLLIIPPTLVHSCHPVDLNRWKFTMLYIDDGWVRRLCGLGLTHHLLSYRRLNKKEYKKTKEDFTCLEKDIEEKEKADILREIIKKYLFEDRAELRHIKLDRDESEKIAGLRFYIEENFDRKLSLDDLAKVSGFSKYHLIRAFKKAYQVSPLTYQRILRFNFAKKELQRRVNISEIALNLGYHDQSHFTNEFRKFSGATPDAYRKNP